MPLPFGCFFLCLLLFLLNYCFLCGGVESYREPADVPSSPNTSCHVTCGDIKFSLPLFLNNTDHASEGTCSVTCISEEPWIKIADREFVVKKILYKGTENTENIVVLQDQALTSCLQKQQCGFLYNFTDPIKNFKIPPRSPNMAYQNSDCAKQTDALSHSFFPTINNSQRCNNYNLYYWDESGDQCTPAFSADCSVAHPTLFQWELSFNIDDDNLSLLSAGFSHRYALQENCFKCSMTGKICANSNCATNSTCFCRDACTSKGLGTSRNRNIFLGIGAGFFLVCLLLALYFYKQRIAIICGKKDLNKNQNIEAFLDEYGASTPKRYSYSDVKKMTKSFQEKLGQGGYGTVFKGTLSNGHVVAVKMLNDSKGDGEEFINEVASIGRTSHVNVVSLLGFCFQGSKRALIYDFMCNGSLEKLLYTEEPKTTLDWEKLYRIAIGIARGLEYLHRGCITRIVHFDIKPLNILLDQDFCPKISDFGLAKLCLKKDSIISIAGARGTVGYIAPEVFSRNFGVVSSKSDVYSYGMMVLEMAGGRKIANAGVESGSEAYFPHWIYEYLDQNRDLLAYGVTAESEETVRKMILVGLWYIQTMPQNRPPMSRVIEMLEGSVNDLQVPPKSYLSSSTLGPIIGSSSLQDICWEDSSCYVHL